MGFLLALLVIVVILLIFGIFYVLREIRKDDYDATISLLDNVFKVLSVVLGIVFLIVTIITGIAILYSELVFVLFVKTLIYISIFIVIYKNTRQLLKHLKNDEIFVLDNVQHTETIGKGFAYLALTELIAGLVIQLFYFLSQISTNFTIQVNTETLVYMAIGLLLIIISKILYKAIEIYEENKLTI